MSTGQTPLTHAGLDEYGTGLAVEHLRALLVHFGPLPRRDPLLARFEEWIRTKVDPLPPHVAQPVEQLATCINLKRIRVAVPAPGTTRGSVHAAKREITEMVEFLTWLDKKHGHTAADCLQQDVDAWLCVRAINQIRDPHGLRLGAQDADQHTSRGSAPGIAATERTCSWPK